MAISKQFVEYVLEQLRGLGRLTSRRMFSGVGLYSDGLFFGLLYHERLYFKTDDTTRPEYEARGSEGFCPRPNLARVKMTYYTVPADVLEDAEELVKWARQATAAALASESAKAAKKTAGESGLRDTGQGKSGQRNKGQGKRRQGEAGQRNTRSSRDGKGRDSKSRDSKSRDSKSQGKEAQRAARPRKVASAAAPTTTGTATNKRAKARPGNVASAARPATARTTIKRRAKAAR
jgi:DNA transformation protein